MDELEELFKVAKYTKVRLTSELAEALTFTATKYRVPRQRLLEGLLAQALFKVNPDLESWVEVQAMMGLSGVPSLTPPPPKPTFGPEYLTGDGEWE